MNNVFLELSIVKVDPANNWQSKEYAAEHFEKGLFIADDGVLYHLVSYQEGWPSTMPIPKDQIEAALVEEARQSGIAEVNGDIDAIKDRVEQIARLVNETKDEVVTRTTVIEDKIDDLGRSGGGEGVNVLDLAKSFAVIQKPELIKELK